VRKHKNSTERKLPNSDKNILPFGGFNFCHPLSKKSDSISLIDKHSGKRVTTIGFGYSEIFSCPLAIFSIEKSSPAKV